MILRLLAAFTTLTAISMAAVSAWDRGGTELDRALLVALSAMVCAGTHLLPALSRRRVTWLLWAGCLLGATYGHLTFFTHAGLRAGQVRAEVSVQAVDVAQQVEAEREALSSIKARPLATVARELSWTKSERRREALETELEEAKRAARLQDSIVAATAAEAAAHGDSRADPVVARLAAVTGSSEAGVSILVGLTFSILLELTGALLWFEALRSNDIPATPESVTSPIADPVADLRQAIEVGMCRPTVASIRVFLGCGQARAMEMRRALAVAEGWEGARNGTK